MEAAVARILEAIDRQEKVVVFGDYDVDGVTSLTLFHRVLSAFELRDFSTFLPHRMDEGYGLSRTSLERCLEAMVQLDANANQATLIECWLDDLRLLTSGAAADG